MITKKRLNYFVYAITLLGILAFIYAARSSLVYLAAGTIIAYVIYPIVDRLDKLLRKASLPKSLSRGFSIIATFIILFGAILFLVINVGGVIVQQLIIIFERLQQSGFVDYLNINIPDLSQFESVEQFINYNLASITNGGAVLDTLGAIISTVSATFDVVFGLLILPFWIFYLLYSPQSVRSSIGKLVPAKLKVDVNKLLVIGDEVAKKYIHGEAILCLTVGTMSTVGYAIIGIPNALGLGIIAGLLELIPYFGPIIATIIAVIVAIPMGWEITVLVLVWAIIVQQIENNILVPKILGTKISVQAWVVLIIITISGALWGLVGMILALPVTSIAAKIIYYIHLRLRQEKNTPQEALEAARKEHMNFDRF